MRIVLIAAAVALLCPFASAQDATAASILADDGALLSAPVADLRREVCRLRLPATPFRSILGGDVSPEQAGIDAMAAAEAKDLGAALEELESEAPQRQQTVVAALALRQRLAEHRLAIKEWEARPTTRSAAPRPTLARVQVPSGLPAEFAQYARGALAWHDGRPDDARAAWAKVLELPARQRRYRSTWAAFMLGVSCAQSDPAKAAAAFAQVRELASLRFVDSLGLAAASYAWEARAELKRKNYARAIDLCLAHHATGDITALADLHRIASAALRDRAALGSLAEGSTSRGAITACILAADDLGRSSCPITLESAGAWLSAIDSMDPKTIDSPERLAWACYAARRYEAAQKWIDRSSPDAAIALWISAKLRLRAGQRTEAAGLMAKVGRAFPADELWSGSDDRAFAPRDRALAELAVIQLARAQYADSLQTFLDAGDWIDAAYVAERVLTPDELIGYVNSRWPIQGAPTTVPATMPTHQRRMLERDIAMRAGIRSLLARRLTRIGRWREARPYFTEDLQARLDSYITAIRAGHDPKRSSADRAESLWAAARIAHAEGALLLATEIEPDWRATDGECGKSIVARRLQSGGSSSAPASLDERNRIGRHAPDPDKRWHYWYTAADHAWAAARLMPENSDRTAQVLCDAGSWLKSKDPRSADRFYKALVTRCSATALGREAARLRWFPRR